MFYLVQLDDSCMKHNLGFPGQFHMTHYPVPCHGTMWRYQLLLFIAVYFYPILATP